MVGMKSIAFSGDMITAIQDDRKTDTRRPLKKQPEHDCRIIRINANTVALVPHDWTLDHAILPEWTVGSPWKKGERLWCREALVERVDSTGEDVAHYGSDGEPVLVDGEPLTWRWKTKALAGRFMPREACRLVIEVRGSKLHNLLRMKPSDAAREGFDSYEEFIGYWDRVYAKTESYHSKNDPLAWCVHFVVVGTDAPEKSHNPNTCP